MVLTDSLDLAPLLDIKTSRAEPFNGTDCQKRTQFTHIRPQKNNFALIEHLFSLRYCLYEQAGSFPGTFIDSCSSQDNLGKYFFHWDL